MPKISGFSTRVLVALAGVIVAFIGFWGVIAQTCTSMLEVMQHRISELENRALNLHGLKLESDLFIVKLEYELKKQNTELGAIQAYIDRVPVPVWIKRKSESGELVMVMINRAYERRYGISKEAYVGQPDSAVWPPDISKKFMEADLEVLRRKTAIKSFEEVIENGVHKTSVFWKFYIQLPLGEKGVGGIESC